MNGPGHAALAAALITAYAQVVDLPPVEQAAATILAVTVANAPDVDNSRWWRKLDKWVPDEALGNGGPLAHRGITHWWVWPVLIHLAGWGAWPTTAIAIGWGGGHLLGDLLFGIKPPGIPVFPWWGHVGLRLDVGGVLEWLTTGALIAATAWMLAGGHPTDIAAFLPIR